MNKNKHPHHDLIVEWAKDTSKQLQGRRIGFGEWLGASVSNLTDADPDYEFRIKPREFTKGHWFPCVFANTAAHVVMAFDGRGFVSGFVSTPFSSNTWCEGDFKWIGESLGEINFGGE